MAYVRQWRMKIDPSLSKENGRFLAVRRVLGSVTGNSHLRGQETR